MSPKLPELTTSRLLLRLGRASDASSVLRHFKENQAHFASTDPPWPSNYYTEAYWQDRLRKAKQEFESGSALRLLMFKLEDPERVIGTINFTQMCRGPFQACYLGYGVSGTEQGKGLMHEALTDAISYVFDELRFHRIMANYLPSNARSAALLKRLGFVIEGYAKEYLFIAGQWRDHVLTSLTNHSLTTGQA